MKLPKLLVRDVNGKLLNSSLDPAVTTPGVAGINPPIYPVAFFDQSADISGSGNLQWDEANSILNIIGKLKLVGSSLIQFPDGTTQNTSTAPSFTAGSIPFAGATGALTQNNAQLFWDNPNLRLGIGTSSPSFPFDVEIASNRAMAVIGNSNVHTSTDGSNQWGMYIGPLFEPSSSTAISQDLEVNPNFAPTTGITITNGIGLLVGAGFQAGAGTVTNGYGLYVNAPTYGSNPYAAYFGGPVGIGVTNPGNYLSMGNNHYIAWKDNAGTGEIVGIVSTTSDDFEIYVSGTQLTVTSTGITLTNKLVSYNSIATTANGVGAIVGADTRTAVTSVDASPITLYSVPAAGGVFEMEANLTLTAYAGSGNVAYTVVYTDMNGNTQNENISCVSVSTNASGLVMFNRVKPSTNITGQLTKAAGVTSFTAYPVAIVKQVA
jgi:hypothetical protein